MSSKQFRVDFFHKKDGATGKGNRVKIQGTVGQALQGAQSETAVLSYLRQKYSGEEITIMKLDFV
jgi:hypothetical protein